MVAEWGMSTEFGLVSYGEGGEVFVGRDYQRTQSYSSEVAAKIDKEIKLIIETAHNKALEILKSNKELIEKLEKVLMEKETIYSEEFELLFQGKSVEEVEEIIDKKEKEKREYQEKARREAETLKIERDKTSQLETAKALLKTGVINEKEFENIKLAIEAESKKNSENTTTEENNESKEEKSSQEEDKK